MSNVFVILNERKKKQFKNVIQIILNDNRLHIRLQRKLPVPQSQFAPLQLF